MSPNIYQMHAKLSSSSSQNTITCVVQQTGILVCERSVVWDTISWVYHEVSTTKFKMAEETLNLKEAFQHGFSIFKKIESDLGSGNSKQLQVRILMSNFVGCFL